MPEFFRWQVIKYCMGHTYTEKKRECVYLKSNLESPAFLLVTSGNPADKEFLTKKFNQSY
jgi:hypothetical protein